ARSLVRAARPEARSHVRAARLPFATAQRGPTPGRDRTARPVRAAVEKPTRASSPGDRSPSEGPADRILGDRLAHPFLWAEARCAQPRPDARISAPERGVLRACGNR